MGTKETSSGFIGEGDEGERLMAIGEGDSVVVFWASMVAVSAACWAADLRSR